MLVVNQYYQNQNKEMSLEESCQTEGHDYIQRENGSVTCIHCGLKLPRDPL